MVSKSAAVSYALARDAAMLGKGEVPVPSTPEEAPLGLVGAFKEIIASEGTYGLFKGLPAMLLKGMPYTVVQLSLFEFLTSTIYSTISEAGTPLSHT